MISEPFLRAFLKLCYRTSCYRVGDRVGYQGGVVGHGVSNHGGVVHSVVSHGGGGVGGGGGVVGGLGVRLSLVADVSDEAVLMVGVVGHDLDAAVRQLHAVLA